jgi:hypothetical protein
MLDTRGDPYQVEIALVVSQAPRLRRLNWCSCYQLPGEVSRCLTVPISNLPLGFFQWDSETWISELHDCYRERGYYRDGSADQALQRNRHGVIFPGASRRLLATSASRVALFKQAEAATLEVRLASARAYRPTRRRCRQRRRTSTGSTCGDPRCRLAPDLSSARRTRTSYIPASRTSTIAYAPGFEDPALFSQLQAAPTELSQRAFRARVHSSGA